MHERRGAERVYTYIDVQWEGAFEKRTGQISDISATGCFVLTGGDVKMGELIALEINVPKLLQMQVWGNVVSIHDEIGFALRFRDLTVTEKMLLSRLVDYVKKKRA